MTRSNRPLNDSDNQPDARDYVATDNEPGRWDHASALEKALAMRFDKFNTGDWIDSTNLGISAVPLPGMQLISPVFDTAKAIYNRNITEADLQNLGIDLEQFAALGSPGAMKAMSKLSHMPSSTFATSGVDAGTSALGGYGGAKLGGMLGSIFPIVGTFGGMYYGSKAGKAIVDAYKTADQDAAAIVAHAVQRYNAGLHVPAELVFAAKMANRPDAENQFFSNQMKQLAGTGELQELIAADGQVNGKTIEFNKLTEIMNLWDKDAQEIIPPKGMKTKNKKGEEMNASSLYAELINTGRLHPIALLLPDDKLAKLAGKAAKMKPRKIDPLLLQQQETAVADASPRPAVAPGTLQAIASQLKKLGVMPKANDGSGQLLPLAGQSNERLV